MTAPVNPEGQTAREPKADWRVSLADGIEASCVDIVTPDGDVVAQVYGNAAHLETAYQRAVAICAARNAGQTAQEVRHLSRIPFTPWCGADEPNQHTTTIEARANCLACFRCALASDAQDVRHAAPEAWHAALERAACEAELHGDGLDGRELAEAIRALASTPSPSPAQPSQDVAGTSGETRAGLSREKAE